MDKAPNEDFIFNEEMFKFRLEEIFYIFRVS